MGAAEVVLLVVAILVVVFVPLAVILAVVFLVVRSKKRQTEADMQSRFGDRAVLIDPMARSFGVESGGRAQIRGNGCLVLLPDRLVFEMWAPKRELSVSLDDVVDVDTASSHLGKLSAMAPLVRVKFRSAAGPTDSVAWQLRDTERWLATLREMAGLE